LAIEFNRYYLKLNVQDLDYIIKAFNVPSRRTRQIERREGEGNGSKLNS
jgi:hypothetical protein